MTVPAELQVSTLVLPLATVGGLAENDTAGIPAGLTTTWMLETLLVPPMPLQVSE